MASSTTGCDVSNFSSDVLECFEVPVLCVGLHGLTDLDRLQISYKLQIPERNASKKGQVSTRVLGWFLGKHFAQVFLHTNGVLWLDLSKPYVPLKQQNTPVCWLYASRCWRMESQVFNWNHSCGLYGGQWLWWEENPQILALIAKCWLNNSGANRGISVKSKTLFGVKNVLSCLLFFLYGLVSECKISPESPAKK